jgi:hypothetical protein
MNTQTIREGIRKDFEEVVLEAQALSCDNMRELFFKLGKLGYWIDKIEKETT